MAHRVVVVTVSMIPSFGRAHRRYCRHPLLAPRYMTVRI